MPIEWIFEEDPHIPGWYAVMYCWEPEEGLFTGAAEWLIGDWDRDLPIVAYAGPFGAQTDAEKWAQDNDVD